MSDFKQEDSQDELRLDPEIEDSYLLTKYPRPEEPVELLTESGDRYQQVQIGGGDCDFDTYCWGFLRAANVVVDDIVQKRMRGEWSDYSTFGESPAYAALFLYRHWLELRLKELISASGDTHRNTHSLVELWQHFTKIDKSGCADLTAEGLMDLKVAERIISQFDLIDSNSQVFRYPRDKEGKVMMPRMCIDLVQVKEAIGWLSRYLRGWSAGIYEMRQIDMEYVDYES